MTIKELKVELEKVDENLTVVSELHSEYTENIEVRVMEGYDNGGYISHPYRYHGFQEHKVKNYLYIGN